MEKQNLSAGERVTWHHRTAFRNPPIELYPAVVEAMTPQLVAIKAAAPYPNGRWRTFRRYVAPSRLSLRVTACAALGEV